MFFGSFVDRGIKELVDSADPTLHISQTAVSERYELGEEIGSGSHGRAILARRIEDGKEVVVKQIRLYEMDDKNRQDTLTEARVLAQFNHVNIVHYHECLLEQPALSWGHEVIHSFSGPSNETPSPSKTPAGGGRRGGPKLVESGWVRQQQAALAELAGVLAAQKAAAGGPGPEAPDPPDRSASMDSTLPSISGSSLGSGVGSSTAAKAKLAEMKLQRDAELETQRRAIAAQREQKKVVQAKRSTETAVAVRNRAAERQKEIDRQVAEQRAEVEAKARKAAQLAAAIKGRELLADIRALLHAAEQA
ncbi:Serine/threonine-protein kinase Nek1 [Tetrabaena socialis]|uniref:non-specific serine/threonine protein kinase n=1 Tax=Tetrabaena socialis TaxID=47790 RepID=A0A2J8A0C9_9CHLO|nr:Serine/threonine-protein kinase Nek1 [Tetrabaena socialis]|eukprot:PNH05982.1 Serine/threonine-protein kinase Nek1 [Tetrabaena socialis]